MKLCEEGHEQICYEPSGYPGKCPLCEARREIDEHELETEKLRDEIDELRGQVKDLEKELAEKGE